MSYAHISPGGMATFDGSLSIGGSNPTSGAAHGQMLGVITTRAVQVVTEAGPRWVGQVLVDGALVGQHGESGFTAQDALNQINGYVTRRVTSLLVAGLTTDDIEFPEDEEPDFDPMAIDLNDPDRDWP